MNAVIYARYSSTAQREESIEGQLRACYEYAQREEINITGEYIDRALSGKTDQRPSFQKMINDSEKHTFDAVIMYTLDRFARNRYDSAIYKAKLKKNGVRLIYVKQPLPDTPEGIILESVLEGYAEYYSENLARNVKRGMRENALKGIVQGSPGLGYRIGTDRRLEIDPATAPAVQIAFEMYARGESLTTIANTLNAKGYKTARGALFTKASFSRLFTNERYIGIYKYDDIVIENCIPPIIDRDLFDRARERRLQNANAPGRQKAKEAYILSGKCYCGHCGRLMIGESGTSKTGATHYYYKCSTRKRGGKCDKKTEKKEPLERLVTGFIIREVLNDENIIKIADAAIKLLEKENNNEDKLLELTRRKNDINKKINNILDAIENGIYTPSTKERLLELETELDIITNELEELKTAPKLSLSRNDLIKWLNQFRNGDITDPDFCARVIDTLLNSVYVYDEDNGGKRFTFIFNTSEHNTQTVTSSDLQAFGPPRTINPNFFIINDYFIGLTITAPAR